MTQSTAVTDGPHGPAEGINGHHRICSLRVSGGFLDGAEFDLAEGLNCLIGARGTGKTTVLEFIRYALDANREPTDVNLRSGGLFHVDIFSQNEVEAVADQSGSQLSLIDNFQATQIAAVENRIRSLVADLDDNASRIIPLQQKIDAVVEELRALPEISEQLKAYVQQGGDDAKAINHAHELKALRDRERRAAEAIRAKLKEVYRTIEAAVGRINTGLAETIADEMRNGPRRCRRSDARRCNSAAKPGREAANPSPGALTFLNA